ncbi:MAG: cysteine peptidase family C39 domain-containing protein, partial [Gammaproteobacteria bacterium]
MERNECGLACLAMVAGGLGIETDLRTLRSRVSPGHAYTNTRQLLQLAQSIGLVGRVMQLDLDDLHRLDTPAVLHWDLDHFVVLEKTSKRSCVVHDPAVGIRTYSLPEVSQHFTGIALEFRKSVSYTGAAPVRRLSIQSLMGGFSRHSPALVQVFILSLLVQALALLSPIYLQLVIDQGIAKGDMDLVVLVALLFAAAAAVKALLSYIRAV